MKWFEAMKRALPFPYWLFILVMFWPFFVVYFVFANFLGRPKKQVIVRSLLAMVAVVFFLGLITALNEKLETQTTKIGPPATSTTESAKVEEKRSETASVKETEGVANNLQKAKVLVVVDGDTVEVEIDGKSERIRMIGVDTPEVVDPRKPVQCFGKEASAFTKTALSGAFVWLESDSTQGDRDKYGRLLRYVWTDQGKTDFNKKLIAEGYAHEYTYNVPYIYRDEYLKAEKNAESRYLGLWDSSVCPTITVTIVSSRASTPKTNCIYSCSGPDKDCSDFKSQKEAQDFFGCCGFSANFDPMRLDNAKGNGNGLACESLP